jgi:hypothetical protein
MDQAHFLAGNEAGAEGEPVPNITPDAKTGLGGWSLSEIKDYLSIGMDPDGDFAGGAMAEVIEHSTGKLSPEDRNAIAIFLKSIAPIERRVKRPEG